MNHLYLPVGSTGELLQRSDLRDMDYINNPFNRSDPSERKLISAWDVDGTLTSDWIDETTGLVYKWMCRKGYVSVHSESHREIVRLEGVLRDNPNEVNRRAYYTAINTAADRTMKLLTPDELQLISRYALVDVPVHEEIRPEIKRMQEMEIPILLASGTPGPLLPAIADEVGAHFIVGTYFPQRNGRYDPSQETVSRGRDKHIYLPQILGALSIATMHPNQIEYLSRNNMLAYDKMPEEIRINVALGAGNTGHDIGILDLAEEKLVVDGDDALLQYAEEHGAHTITTANSARKWLQSVSV